MRSVLTVISFIGLGQFIAHMALAAPDNATISEVLNARIVEQKDGVALVVGITEPEGHRIVAAGMREAGGTTPVDSETVFEIGSVTKIFTSLVLADMAQREELSLNDPVQSLLPASARMPTWQGQDITLRHLSRHTSALPRLPGNLNPTDPLNPYADYTVEQMYAFLNAYDLIRPPGQLHEYSNLGVGLLGHALSHSADLEYETLVKSRILLPLGMTDTAIALSEDQSRRFVTGHNALLIPTPPWDIPSLAGAGALRSTATDLLTFLDAHLDRVKTPLTKAMALMTESSQEILNSNARIALGWVILGDDDPIFFHNGMTGGYSAFVGFRPRTETGVVILANAARNYDDIGRNFLDQIYDLKATRPVVTVDPSVLVNYEGQYQLTPNLILSVFRKGKELYIQATGQPEIQMSPASIRVFFNEAVGAEITFDDAEDRWATSLTLRQGGQTLPAPRIK